MALNSKEKICFFCLREFSKYSQSHVVINGKQTIVTVQHQFLLQTIFRYIEQFEVISKSLQKNPQNTSCDNSIAFICDDCSKMTREFTELFKILVETKQRIVSCIQQINQIMVNAVGSQSSELVVLRDKVLSQMKLIRPTTPVIIPQSDIPEIRGSTTPTIENECPPEILSDPLGSFESDGISSNSLPILKKVNSEDESGYSPAVITKSNGTKVLKRRSKNVEFAASLTSGNGDFAKSSKKYQSQSTQSQSSDETNHLNCPFCRAVFLEHRPNRRHRGAHGAWMLRQHLLQYHTDHFFSTQKLPSISDASYKKILVELLFQGLAEGRTSCKFCDKKFVIPSKLSNKNAHYTRIHLHYVDDHFKNLEDRLQQIQRNPKLENILRMCNPQGRHCECGVYVQNVYGFHAHTKLHCSLTQGGEFFIPKSGPIAERPQLPVTETEIVGKVKCDLCSKIVNRKYAKQHVGKNCKNKCSGSAMESSINFTAESYLNVEMEIDIDEDVKPTIFEVKEEQHDYFTESL